MGALRLKASAAVADSIKDVRKQLDNAKQLGLEFALTFGVSNAKDYENYFQVMADAAAYAQERGIKLVLKPHGGGSGAAADLAPFGLPAAERTLAERLREAGYATGHIEMAAMRSEILAFLKQWL